MEKKKKIIVLCSIILVLVVLIIAIIKNTYAIDSFTNTLSLECDKYDINIGEEFTCKIVGNFENKVSGFSSSVVVSDNLEIKSITSDWEAELSSLGDNEIVLVSVDKPITGNPTIANITLVHKDSSNIKSKEFVKLSNNSITIEDNENTVEIDDIADIAKNINVLSNNVLLDFISINGKEIADFSSSIDEYIIKSLDEDVITISADPVDQSSTVSGDIGEKKLKRGEFNTFKIYVTSELGNKGIYTLKIYRPSDDATLKSLTIDGINFDFDPNVLNYDVVVSTESVNIKVESTVDNSMVEGIGEMSSLKYGDNKFEVVVTAESGNKKIYVINVIRKDNNAILKYIKLGDKEIKYGKDKTENIISVMDSSINIGAVTESSRATVVGDGEKKLNYGYNEFNIIVTAENGDKKIYKFIVNRISNNTLSELTINKKNIDLDDKKYIYTYEVDNSVTEAEIGAILKDNKNKFVSEYGPRKISDLEVGNNKVEIKIEGQDGEIVTYVVNIIRADLTSNESENVKTGVLSMSIILIIALSSLLVGIIVYRKKTGLV